MSRIVDLNYTFSNLVIKHLVQQGVRHFCIAPGSRSTPMVLAADRHPLANTHIHHDERGLGFFALGMAKKLKGPVVVITTSGTAVANLFPSVVEAALGKQPLIILSCDRPPDLLQCGANQAIDQIKLFGNYVSYHYNFPPPCDQISFDYIQTQISKAVFQAEYNNKPVHINCMLSEPFLSKGEPDSFNSYAMGSKKLHIYPPSPTLIKKQTDHLREVFAEHNKGLIVASGNLSENDNLAIDHFANMFQWPVLAEVHSNFHKTNSELQVSSPELVCKKITSCTELHPTLIVLFGEKIVSKDLLLAMKTLPIEEIVYVSPNGDIEDPFHTHTHKIVSDIPSFCSKITEDMKENMENRFCDMWLHAGNLAQDSLKTLSQESELYSIHSLLQSVENSNLFIGNSMPIRYANMVYGKEYTFLDTYANRGASGIDGNIATACGICKASNEPLVAILGDTTVHHDINSFALAKELPITFVIINNGGGAIFSHLPIYQRQNAYEKYFYNKQEVHFEHIAAAYNLNYHKVQIGDAIEFKKASIVEVIIEPEKSLQAYHAFIEALDISSRSIKRYAKV